MCVASQEELYSCVKRVRKSVHIALPPKYLGSELSGISDTFESWKNKYNQRLGGVLISYENACIACPQGVIITDQPVIHYEVTADFFVFQPSEGNVIKGVINRISLEHIGCIIHNCINVSIEFDGTARDELEPYIALGNDILFEVLNVDFHKRAVRVRGRITEECIKLMKESNMVTSKSCDANDGTSGEDLDNDSSDDE